MNPLVRFNKTREIFSSFTRVLRILLTTTANSGSVGRANFQGRVAFSGKQLASGNQRFSARVQLPDANYAQRRAQ